MPRRDGTGPMGQGQMAGRRLGRCNSGLGRGLGLAVGLGLGLGLRRGFRRFFKNQTAVDDLTLLKSQAEKLEEELNVIKTKISELEQSK